MNWLTRMRRTAAVSAGLGLLLPLAACGSDQPDPIPPAPPSESNSAATSSPSTSSTETDEFGGPPAGWEDEFSDRQLRAYRAALASSDRYRRGSVPIYAEGKNTPAARQFFKARDLRWREQVRILQGIEQAGLRELRPPEPLWSRAESVQFGQDGTGTVLISQCTDYTDMRWERGGKPEKGLKPKTLVTPLLIRMEKRETQGSWMLAESQLKGKKSCAG